MPVRQPGPARALVVARGILGAAVENDQKRRRPLQWLWKVEKASKLAGILESRQFAETRIGGGSIRRGKGRGERLTATLQP